MLGARKAMRGKDDTEAESLVMLHGVPILEPGGMFKESARGTRSWS